MSAVNEGKMLLHACCAPCAEYPVSDLLSQDIRPDILYYNPNIHPKFEFERRREQVVKLGEIYGLSCFYSDDFRMDDWLSKSWEGKFDSRCDMCYFIRMDFVARYAKEHGYQSFGTSLLVSPYQQHEKIASIASECAKKYGVQFSYYDWRPHFREGQTMAREHGLYRQKYCGCIYSLEDSEFKEKIISGFPDSWEASR
ncbi:MAG: epoxyqueuosine reductase QueH [Clostridiales bacterium]|nr:epoxyqueuosine reductase QueH [Clostridiales bacterium]MBR4819652.1 epoxyqueuosine reductase QueH [Clostridiales bacterium]MBR5058837.1 epoxyqueuosine reductase QueH [Clostridiales bacterium]